MRRIAFLGPKGTWSELALTTYSSQSEAIAENSLGAVFKSLLTEKAEAALVPLENILEGPVTETLDLLLRFRSDVEIIDSFLLPINHALGALEEVKLSELEKIYSHPQALGQCSQNLSAIAPKALLVPTSSTSAAIDKVKEETRSAVIAPPSTLKENGFRILSDKVSDSENNVTRFILVSKRNGESKVKEGHEFVTSICLHPHRDRQGLLHEVLEVVSVESGINILSIHSRPDSSGGFVFHFDLEGSIREKCIASCLERLEQYCERVTGETVELTVIGSYPFQTFHRLPFSSVCIVGGKGRMGVWMERFLSEKGLAVKIFDRDSGDSLKSAISDVDVVLLSIPMSVLPSLQDELVEALRPGQLVVENFSIKASSLPLLSANLPKDVELLGIHTMFGSDTPSISDQNVIVTETSVSGTKAKAFEDLLYKHGANLKHIDAETHDRVSSMIQSLFQLIFISIAETSRELGLSPAELEAQSTPNSRAVWKAVERCLSLNDELLLDLQTLNPQALGTRRKFLEILFEHVSKLDNKDTSKLLESIKKSSKLLN